MSHVSDVLCLWVQELESFLLEETAIYQPSVDRLKRRVGLLQPPAKCAKAKSHSMA